MRYKQRPTAAAAAVQLNWIENENFKFPNEIFFFIQSAS